MRIKGLLIAVLGGLLVSGCEYSETRVFEDMGKARQFQRDCIEKQHGRVLISDSKVLNTVTITCKYYKRIPE